MNDTERRAAIWYRENHVLFLHGHASCSGTVAYCKATARQNSSNQDTVYHWEIRDPDGHIIYHCEVRKGERLQWIKTANMPTA
jgi:hypothetical protein